MSERSRAEFGTAFKPSDDQPIDEISCGAATVVARMIDAQALTTQCDRITDFTV